MDDIIKVVLGIVVFVAVSLVGAYFEQKKKTAKKKEQQEMLYNIDYDVEEVDVEELEEIFENKPNPSPTYAKNPIAQKVYAKSEHENNALKKNQEMLQKANKMQARIVKTETKNINEKKMQISDKKIQQKSKPKQIAKGKDLKQYFLFHEVIDKKYGEKSYFDF